MAARFIWRSSGKLALACAGIGSGVGAAAIATSDDPLTTLKLCSTVPTRLARISFTAAAIALDYEYSLWGLQDGSAERMQVKHEVHLRGARRVEELCFKNRGIYIKLGQHISQLEYLVPQEYVQIMRESLLNKCPVSSYDEVCEVVKKELGGAPEEIFKEFDPVPIASGSLAQVHIARTHDGDKVAVKVQHAHMTDTALADYATVELIVNFLHRLFPSFDYRWLVDEVHESLPKVEGTMSNLIEFIKNKNCPLLLGDVSGDYIYAPTVYWNLSSKKLLTMEFMDCAQVNDVKRIQQLGIQPMDVVKLVSQAFAEMIFKHGFVHCDPHAANILIRPLPSSGRNILGRRKPQLVLIDHGLYKELDPPTRTNYAALWKSLVFADANGIKESSVKLGAGEDLHEIFAGVLTFRPWNKVIDPAIDHLAIQSDGSNLDQYQMYASQHFSQISELICRLPRVILLMLKTNDCIRAVNGALVKGSSLETFLIIGRISGEAVIESRLKESKSLLSRISIWVDGFKLELRLFAMHMALWVLRFRKTLSLT